jgi:hypothetical protein
VSIFGRTKPKQNYTHEANKIQGKLSAIQLRIIFSPPFIKKWKE